MPTRPRPVFYIEISSGETKSAAQKCAALFGRPEGELGTPSPAVDAAVSAGAYPWIGGGLRAVADHFRPGDTLLYAASEDLEADLRRVNELGGTVLLAPTRVSDVHSVALIADANGARVLLGAGGKAP